MKAEANYHNKEIFTLFRDFLGSEKTTQIQRKIRRCTDKQVQLVFCSNGKYLATKIFSVERFLAKDCFIVKHYYLFKIKKHKINRKKVWKLGTNENSASFVIVEMCSLKKKFENQVFFINFKTLQFYNNFLYASTDK